MMSLLLLCLFIFFFFFFFSSRRRHTRCALVTGVQTCALPISPAFRALPALDIHSRVSVNWAADDGKHRRRESYVDQEHRGNAPVIRSGPLDRKSTRLNSSH